MEQQTQRNPLAVFVSNGLRGLSVTAAVEDFGYEMKPYGTSPEEHELVQYDHNRKPLGFKAIVFGVDGRYEARDPRVVDCLRRHPANLENGGNDFSEIPEEVLHATVGPIKPHAKGTGEDVLTEEDTTLLERLNKRSERGILPKLIAGVLADMQEAVNRFQVIGFVMPEPDKKERVIKAKLITLLDLLEEAGIYLEGADEERGNTGPGAEADG